jgi:hypothetical protein
VVKELVRAVEALLAYSRVNTFDEADGEREAYELAHEALRRYRAADCEISRASSHTAL